MTDVWMDGKRVEKLEIFSSGEDAQDFFIRATMPGGQRIETGIARGTC